MGTVKHIFVAAKHGVRPNDLRGRRFRIGSAVFVGLELSEIRVTDSVLESAMERAP
jgi:hypothetical protein